MIEGLGPYPEMKESGVPGVGGVPAHWAVRRLKTVFCEVDDRSTTGAEPLLSLRMNRGLVDHHGEGGKVIPPDALVGYKRARPGELVMNRMRAATGLFGEAPKLGLVSPDYAVLRPMIDASLRFYVALFQTSAMTSLFRLESRGLGSGESGFLRLYTDRFGLLSAPVPPVEEQQMIMRFLDRADGRIRRLIAAKQRMIKLLEEQKRATVLRFMTRGTDPEARLRRSGVAWLGDVPEEWSVKRLKWVTRLQRGYDLPADSRVAGPFPVISSGGFIDSHAEARATGPGVVMGRYGSTDAVFFVEPDFWPHNTALFVTDFQGNDRKWCYYLLRTISKADHAGKSAVPGVDRKDLFEIMVAVPPILEQAAIVSEIEHATRELDTGLQRIAAEIALLREYRTRLVSDVVTGKLDVRAAAAALPDEDEPVEPLDDEEVEDDDTLDASPDEPEP